MSFLALCVLISLAVCVQSADQTTQKLFDNFVSKYQKQYSVGEYNLRLGIFQDNLEKVNEMNSRGRVLTFISFRSSNVVFRNIRSIWCYQIYGPFRKRIQSSILATQGKNFNRFQGPFLVLVFCHFVNYFLDWRNANENFPKYWLFCSPSNTIWLERQK